MYNCDVQRIVNSNQLSIISWPGHGGGGGGGLDKRNVLYKSKTANRGKCRLS